MSSAILHMIQEGLEDLQISHYTQLSSASLIIYEYLITLSDEINLVWPSSWTPVKILFLVNRYYILFAVALNTYALLGPPYLSDDFCLHYFKWQGTTALISTMMADGILQFRLYAMYSMNKRMLALMLTCFTVAISISGYILHTILVNVVATAISSPLGGMVCFPSNLTNKFYLFWAPLMAFDCLLFGLAVFRGLQTLKRSGSFGRKLLIVLIRDSVMYFFAICMTYVAFMLAALFAPTTLLEVPLVFTLAIGSVLSNRVVLNIRTATVEVADMRQPTPVIRFTT